jgi:hypothetical protein
MQERLAHSDKLYRVKVPVNSLVALECGRILGAARRALWPNVLNRSRNVAALGEIPRSFRSLAPLWCCQATQRVLAIFHICGAT